MDDLNSTLSAILGDPAKMEQLRQVAQSLGIGPGTGAPGAGASDAGAANARRPAQAPRRILARSQSLQGF